MSAVTANHNETDILVGCHSMHLLSWMTKNHMLVDAVNIKLCAIYCKTFNGLIF